ncbi:MAG: histidine kinase, partial [Bacteroidota bacterium]
MEIAKKNKFKGIEANANLIIGKAFLKKSEPYKAIDFLQEASLISKNIKDLKLKSESNKELSAFYEYTGYPIEALGLYKLYKKQNDSLIGENHLEAISELGIKYETQKKENELLKLTKEQQENELVITQQNRRLRRLSFGISGLVLFGFLGFLLFRQRLQNKKQEELLLAISETQTDERKRIAQDLHDSIGGSLALIKAKFETAKTKLSKGSNELESALETLDKTTQQVRQISHNLMPGELVRFGLIAAINTLLENLNEDEINAQFHTNQKDERMEPLKEIQLYRIIQEAIQNVLKHAKAKNLIIQLNKHKEHFSLMIEDDGNGMENKGNDGMGLKNIEQRVQLLKG